ncbi:MAG: BatA domain-containing protein [Planctomycetota bacterium]|nr:BatA domain-containing protein [Planctomycetota bacterium]
MTFSDPRILVGLVALGIPLAIHLLGRRQARRVILPTARFAEGAHQARRGLLWLKRAGLLALRLAAVALLVVALAGPRIGGARSPGEAGAWAVCLDTSPSMATLEKGVSRYTAAREAALGLLGRLGGDEQVLLVRCGEKALRGTPERLRAALAEDAPSAWSDEAMGSLISRAVADLPQGKARLVVLTDATPWALRDLGAGEFRDAPADVLLVPVGSDAANARLGLPRIAVVETPEGLRLSLEVDVALAESARGATVRLALDGGTETFSAQAAAGHGRVRFLVPVSGPGPWQGRVWLDGTDALAMDNERFFTAVAPVASRVLVVNGAEGAEKVPAAVHIAAAFAGQDPLVPKEARKVDAGRVEAKDLAASDVVFWVGVCGPSASGWLREYVEKGGSLVWIPAGAKAPGAELAGLAGAEIGDAEAAGDGVTLDPGGYASDLLGAFEGGTAADIAKPVFRSRLVLAAREGIPAVRFADGRPAIVSRVLGRGRVVAFGVGPGEEWGDLGARPEFVVLMHSLVEALAPSGSPRQANRVMGRSVGGPGAPGSRPGNFSASPSPGGGWKGPFSVNVAAEETADLGPDADRLASAFSAEGARVCDASQVFISDGFASGSASDAAAWFILPLAVVVLVETLVVSGGPIRSQGR